MGGLEAESALHSLTGPGERKLHFYEHNRKVCWEEEWSVVMAKEPPKEANTLMSA